MNSIEFVNAIKIIMRSAIKGLISSFENPPGRAPDEKSVQISDFYKIEDDLPQFDERWSG